MNRAELSPEEQKAQKRRELQRQLRQERFQDARAEQTSEREPKKVDVQTLRKPSPREDSTYDTSQADVPVRCVAVVRNVDEGSSVSHRQRQAEIRAEVLAAELRIEQRRTQREARTMQAKYEEATSATARERDDSSKAVKKPTPDVALSRSEDQKRDRKPAQNRTTENLDASVKRESEAEEAVTIRADQRRGQRQELIRARQDEVASSEALITQTRIQQAELRGVSQREEARRSRQADLLQARQVQMRQVQTRQAEESRAAGKYLAASRAAELERNQQEQAREANEVPDRLAEETRVALRREQQKQRLSWREQAEADARLAATREEQRRREERQLEATRHAEVELRASAASAQEDRQRAASAVTPRRQPSFIGSAQLRPRAAMTPGSREILQPSVAAGGQKATDQPSLPPPYLQTSGKALLDQNNQPVTLRGVTVRGLDSVATTSNQSFPAALSLDSNNLFEITNQWDVNLVRLSFQAKTILSGNGSVSSTAMLSGLDATITAITEAGAYVLLAMEPAPASGGVPPAPDSNTTQIWQLLATRYQSEPRVLYEIFASETPLAENWMQSAAALVDAIRKLNSASVIFLGSGLGGADVTGLPMRSQSGDPVPNLVYTVASSAQSAPDSEGPFGELASSCPVMVSMWSDDGSDLGRLTSRVADLFERLEVSWAAANWNADPRLVSDPANQDFTPTSWGQIVQRALAVSAETSFRPTNPESGSIFGIKGPALSQLSTSGSVVVDQNGNAVNLRGVSVQGLDTVAPNSNQAFPEALALDNVNLVELTEQWGVNLVRLPFQAQTITSGNGNVSVVAMLAGLDATVSAITQAGMYVLLAQTAPLVASGSPVAPDPASLQVWQSLAERYSANPAVLFEILSSASPFAPGWPQLAASYVTAIRQRKAGALIFLGSGNGGSDVSGLPLLSATDTPMVNLVYTVALSPETPLDPSGNLQSLAQSSPVFASLWVDDGSDYGWSSFRTADFLDRNGIGFAAANWNADPRLVADAAGHDFTATSWGLTAGRAIKLPGKMLLKPLGP